MQSVLWLGGAPCSGKSSVARLLGERFALAVVHVDDTIDAFLAQLDPERHPALSGWMALNWDERWSRPPDVLLGEVVACYREHLGFVRERVLTRSIHEGRVRGRFLVSVLGFRWFVVAFGV